MHFNTNKGLRCRQRAFENSQERLKLDFTEETGQQMTIAYQSGAMAYIKIYELKQKIWG